MKGYGILANIEAFKEEMKIRLLNNWLIIKAKSLRGFWRRTVTGS